MSLSFGVVPRSSNRLRAVAAVGVAMMLAGAIPDTAGAQETRPIVVRVVDAADASPLAGVELRLVDETGTVGPSTRTGSAGTARIRTAAVGATLSIRAVGYASRMVSVPLGASDSDTLSVRLEAVALSLDQMVITAARRPQRLTDAVVTTEVVSRREIENSGASDLASVLTEQTGVQLQGGHPSGAGVMLQGIGSERVLVMLDGQPLVGRISGNFDLSRIPTGMIERVEVVKGPQSTLYGSEAMGGVVNIVTRTADPDGWQAGATFLGGSNGRLDGSVSAGGGRGDWSGTLDLGMRQVHRAPGVASTAGALADRADVSAKARWEPASDRWAEFTVLRLDERQRWASSSMFDFADNVQSGARLSASKLFGEQRFTPTLHYSSFEHLARSSRTGTPIAGTGDRQVQRLMEAELLYAGRVGGLAVDAGLEARREMIESSDGRIAAGDDGDSASRTLHAVEPFAQFELGGDAWSVVPGARLTWNEQWGTAFTPRIAARWRATPALTLRLAAGQGFRAPGFKELYLQFTNESAGYAVYGNPDLRPEHSDNVTAGAEWSSGAVYARGQLFWNRLRDFIEARPLPDAAGEVLYGYANVEQGLTQGMDLEAGVVLGGIRAEAAYGWLSATDRLTDLPLLGRPTHSGRVTLSGGIPVLGRVSLTSVYTGRTPMERDEDTGAVTGERDSFLRLDARLARRLPFGSELSVGVDNVFDSRPDLWEGAIARHIYTALTFNVGR